MLHWEKEIYDQHINWTPTPSNFYRLKAYVRRFG